MKLLRYAATNVVEQVRIQRFRDTGFIFTTIKRIGKDPRIYRVSDASAKRMFLQVSIRYINRWNDDNYGWTANLQTTEHLGK